MATSPITISTTIVSTAQIPDPSGSNLKVYTRLDDTYTHTTTTVPATYTAAASNIATDIYNAITGLSSAKVPAAYTSAGANYTGTGTSTPVAATVSFVQVRIMIDNVQAPDYTSPRYYATQFRAGTATPGSDAVAFVQPREFNGNFAIGPNDYTSQATLAAIYLTQLTAAQVASGYA